MSIKNEDPLLTASIGFNIIPTFILSVVCSFVLSSSIAIGLVTIVRQNKDVFLGLCILAAVAPISVWLFMISYYIVVDAINGPVLYINRNYIFDTRIMSKPILFSDIEEIKCVYSKFELIAIKVRTMKCFQFRQSRFRIGCIVGTADDVAIISLYGLNKPKSEIIKLLSTLSGVSIDLKPVHRKGL